MIHEETGLWQARRKKTRVLLTPVAASPSG